jgi:hypothetical protein
MLTLLKVLIAALIFLSLFGTFYEYDNYKRQARSGQFLYEEGQHQHGDTEAERYEHEQATYRNVIDAFGQLLVLNAVIVALVILHQVLARKEQADVASRRWQNPPQLPLFP